MEGIINKIKDMATLYTFSLILVTAIFTLYIDCKSLRKKKLFREEKICRIIGYGYLIAGGVIFIATKFIL